MKTVKTLYKHYFDPPCPLFNVGNSDCTQEVLFLDGLIAFTQHCCGGGGRPNIIDHDCSLKGGDPVVKVTFRNLMLIGLRKQICYSFCPKMFIIVRK